RRADSDSDAAAVVRARAVRRGRRSARAPRVGAARAARARDLPGRIRCTRSRRRRYLSVLEGAPAGGARGVDGGLAGVGARARPGVQAESRAGRTGRGGWRLADVARTPRRGGAGEAGSVSTSLRGVRARRQGAAVLVGVIDPATVSLTDTAF